MYLFTTWVLAEGGISLSVHLYTKYNIIHFILSSAVIWTSHVILELNAIGVDSYNIKIIVLKYKDIFICGLELVLCDF